MGGGEERAGGGKVPKTAGDADGTLLAVLYGGIPEGGEGFEVGWKS